ncbi:acid phosphatase [Gordonia iterans]
MSGILLPGENLRGGPERENLIVVTRSRLLFLSLFSSLALLLTSFSTTVAAPPAQAAPAGFGPAQLIGPFESDIPPGGTYIPVLDGFTVLREHHPKVIKQNLDTVIEINHAADPAQRKDAIEINYDDRLLSLTYALGDRAGAAFRSLLAAGKLPKVEQLTSGYTARTMLPLGTTLLEKEYYDNPRPFEVAPRKIKRYDRPGGSVYSDVAGNGSYPSGHTAMGYWTGALMASWIPELGPQIIARSGDIGRSRIVLGVHFPLDVMGGRIMGQDLAAARLNDPAFSRLIREAGTQLRTQLSKALGQPLARVVAADPTVQPTAQALASHRADMVYSFDPVFPTMKSTIPASAAALLRTRFPHLSDAQRLDILRRTAVGPGYPLDQSGVNGGWVRIDLAAAYAATP